MDTDAADHGWIDCTLPVHPQMVTYPGDRPFVRTISHTVDAHGCELSSISCSAHCGTHVDGQRHFVPEGMGVDEWPLDNMIGDAWLVDVAGFGDVTAAALECVPAEVRRIIIRTANTSLGSLQNGVQHAWLGVDAADWLLERGIVCVLFDGLSVEAPHTDCKVHRLLLGAGVVLVEGVVMKTLEPGWWWIVCAPIRICGGDGAPARVVMRRDGGGSCAR